ncbi:hypothetical protein ACFVW8_24190 [Streptomyces sp. NPDC058221]|uniref:hypothetical protein n=1 Tax=Streptomyces sp. NPDC058221 TaxID=3346388 RepID=UPI0036EBD352
MGDYFQSVVDLDATERDAQELGARVLDWLIAEGIVAAERTDCVLDGDGYGHAPGPHFAKAVEDPEPVDLWTNGLYVHTGRTVFGSDSADATGAVCPLCRAGIRLADEQWEPIAEAWRPFRGAFHDWAENGGDGIVQCPSCARPSGIATWGWEDDYYAFGQLGFTFWGWAELTFEFTREIGRRLGGHRTAVFSGKM